MSNNINDKDFIIATLQNTRRPGIKDLILLMEQNGFFDAPASGGNHSHKIGGLAHHTRNVIETAQIMSFALFDTNTYLQMYQSVRISAALHDLGKMGDHGKPLYVANMVKDGRPTKANPMQRYKQSDTKPWVRNKDLTNIPHSFRSVIIAEQYIELTEDEEYAIMYHDGLYDRETGGYAVIPGHETPLLMILHWSDMWVSKVLER